MEITQIQLDEEKLRLKEEIENCKDCKLEERLLGNGMCCDYHRNIIKYLKTFDII